MNIRSLTIAVSLALGLVPGAAKAASLVSMAGDADCFGLGGSCADGSLYKTQLGGDFFADYRTSSDNRYTDHWDLIIDPTFTLAASGVGSGILQFRIAGVADGRGPWNVVVNGTTIGSIPDDESENAYQAVKTFSYLVPSIDLKKINNVVLQINDPRVNDGYILDYVSLTSMSAVPLPASAPMFGAALLVLAGFGYGMNRWVAPKGRKATAA